MTSAIEDAEAYMAGSTVMTPGRTGYRAHPDTVSKAQKAAATTTGLSKRPIHKPSNAAARNAIRPSGKGKAKATSWADQADADADMDSDENRTPPRKGERPEVVQKDAEGPEDDEEMSEKEDCQEADRVPVPMSRKRKGAEPRKDGSRSRARRAPRAKSRKRASATRSTWPC